MQALQRRKGHQRQLDVVVSGKRLGVDDIDVRLGEFPVATFLRPLPPPDLLNLVAAERKVQLVRVLEHIAGERHGQIEVQAEVRPRVLVGVQTLEDVYLLVDLALLGQPLDRLHGPGLDRSETVQLEGLPQPVEHELLDDPSVRCELGKAGQRLGATQRTSPRPTLPDADLAGMGCPHVHGPSWSAGRGRAAPQRYLVAGAPSSAGFSACRPGYHLANQCDRSSPRTRRPRRKARSPPRQRPNRPPPARTGYGTSPSQLCAPVHEWPRSPRTQG